MILKYISSRGREFSFISDGLKVKVSPPAVIGHKTATCGKTDR